MEIVAVRDVKANCFKYPYFAIAKGSAIRDFFDACVDSKSPISQHPEDYQLFALGSFDEQTGVMSCEALPVLLCSASEFTNKVKTSEV